MQYKTALITGASSGIGRAAAIALAKEGVELFLCARSKEKLEETKRLCSGSTCTIYPVDLGCAEEITRLVSCARQTMGTIDILLCCAGIYPQDGLEAVTSTLWDEVMTVNLKNTFLLGQEVFAHMKEQSDSYIIFINSTVALGAKPDVTAYSVSKYGLDGVAAAFYEEGKQYGIRVSSIYPGVTDTTTLRHGGMPCAPWQCMQPEDIAACILFLVSSPPRMIVKQLVPWACAYDQI